MFDLDYSPPDKCDVWIVDVEVVSGCPVSIPFRTITVTRNCTMALHRASEFDAPYLGNDLVVVTEPRRCISEQLIEATFGMPVAARVAVTPEVAAAADSGDFGRLPRTLRRNLTPLADSYFGA